MIKKIAGLLAVMLMVFTMGSSVFAHCGHCGISDGYVCAKDKVASNKPGACSACGGELAKGDVQEVKTEQQVDGKTVEKITYVPA